MNKLQPIRPFIVPLAVIGYILFALLAYIQVPGPFTPLANWLSDLGDLRRNPQGALLYNLGIILSALLILLFFMGLSYWKMESRKIQNSMVQLTQLFGILGSAAMLMSGIFPINTELHSFWSILLYILLGTAFGFSVAALRYQPGFPRWALGLGLITALVDILSGIFHNSTVIEWLTVALFLTYLFVLNLQMEPLWRKVGYNLHS